MSGGSNKDKKEEEVGSVKDRKSPFDSFLEEWTWGQVNIHSVASLSDQC